ncbi:hypothetical protein [Sphingobacterium sp. LRF_L2]|uniref:hypothetical protein n=1 Tax=Sphingobacterium sp. LRF_L2 TaxID=3369421 RepID=UPI003F600F73
MKVVSLVFILLFFTVLHAQDYGSRHQLGFNLGLQVGMRQETGYMLKVFGNCGYGYEMNGLFPNVHVGTALNLKTLSTRQEKKNQKRYKSNHSFEFILGAANAFRFGPWNSRSTWTKDAYLGQPYYLYANLNQSPLMHPFHSSFSMGTELIYLNDDKGFKHQRVGFLDIKIYRAQLYYQNDGAGPFEWFGKALIEGEEDRFYTSSMLISYHLANNNFGHVNTLSLSFNKFTGDYDRAYKVASSLRNNTVDYKDVDQYAYNLSFVGFGVKFNDFAEISIRKYNSNDRLDPQNLIHYGGNMPYHINSTMEHWGMDLQRSIGVLSNVRKK